MNIIGDDSPSRGSDSIRLPKSKLKKLKKSDVQSRLDKKIGEGSLWISD